MRSIVVVILLFLVKCVIAAAEEPEIAEYELASKGEYATFNLLSLVEPRVPGEGGEAAESKEVEYIRGENYILITSWTNHGRRVRFTEEDLRYLTRPCYVNKHTDAKVPPGLKTFHTIQKAIDACESDSIIVQRDSEPYAERLVFRNRKVNLHTFDGATIMGDGHVIEDSKVTFVGFRFFGDTPKNAQFLEDALSAPEE